MRRQRNIKIVATLGPSSSDYDTIKDLHLAGADVFRLNMSHGTHDEIAKRHTELDKNRNIFVMCHVGTRSQAVVKWLKAQGYEHSVNVLGGIDAWAALIDRDIRRY